MPPQDDPCAFERIDAAFRAGDLAALRSAVDSTDLLPNGLLPFGIGHCLEYAIYHSPLSFIRELLEIGADPNPDDHAGFPPLIAALCSGTRPDTMKVVELLLSFGADPDQRGLNDYTALHMAVAERNRDAAELLLSAGADPHLRTRIDDLETPLDLAWAKGFTEIAELLSRHSGS
jgi:ankyrin repeat protein